MFTGLVEDIGEIVSISGLEQFKNENHETKVEECKVVISVNAESQILEGVKLGDSIAVNGVCLTVTWFTTEKEHKFQVGVAPETLRRTNLGDLKEKSEVNLERSLKADSRIGGHFVQGHVDGTGTIKEKNVEKESLWVKISAAPPIMKYIVEKGYIAVDGTSLTVCDVTDETFTFMLVSYTQKKIIIPNKKIGERVNLEVDILGKYVEKFTAKK